MMNILLNVLQSNAHLLNNIHLYTLTIYIYFIGNIEMQEDRLN